MKSFFKLFILACLFASCEDVEPTIFNGKEGNPVFLSFSRSEYTLPIVRDGIGALDIVLQVSTLSSSDRTYNVELIPNDTPSAANPATYSYPATITIPAGQYTGILKVTGLDGGMVDGVAKFFAIRIPDSQLQGISFDSNQTSIKVVEVCPLEASFTGSFLMEQTSPVWPSTDDFAFGSDIIVDIKVGDNDYERIFEASPYPTFGFPAETVRMTFTCEGVNLSESYNLGSGCTEDETILFNPGANPTPYDPADDSVFTLTITENAARACGGAPRQTSIQFTKVE